MPYLRITTNQPLEPEPTRTLLKTASQRVAALLGKPEASMMVAVDAGLPMLFGGTDRPCAFLELRGIGLPTEKTMELSRSLGELVTARLGIPKDRTYINFADVPARLWGWNGKTF